MKIKNIKPKQIPFLQNLFAKNYMLNKYLKYSIKPLYKMSKVKY